MVSIKVETQAAQPQRLELSNIFGILSRYPNNKPESNCAKAEAGLHLYRLHRLKGGFIATRLIMSLVTTNPVLGRFKQGMLYTGLFDKREQQRLLEISLY